MTVERHTELHSEPLNERDLDADPVVQFGCWFEKAAEVVRMPEAMAIATASADGRPSVRMVLMKDFDQRGFVFHSHYESPKARDLAANPVAALLFHWDPLGRQVRIVGAVEKLDGGESDRYFTTRPRGGQIGAHVSEQSRPIESRELLDERVADLTERYEGRPVPRPEHWGGFRLRPESFEFWQSRDDRLHDRFLYRRAGDIWTIERLQP